MNVETSAWFCHGCKRRGSTAVTLVAYVLDLSPMRAKKVLREAYDPGSFRTGDGDVGQEIRDYIAKIRVPKDTGWHNGAIDEEMMEAYTVDWVAAAQARSDGEGFPPCNYMLQRGFTPETLEDWQFGYDERTGRIVFPVRNELGQLIGFKGRATDGREPKYLVIGDSDGMPVRYGHARYYTGIVVFGLDRAVQHMDDRLQLIVCEGELNAIALSQMGFSNSVALNGSRLTRRQQQLIRACADEVIMFFDFDKAGQEGMWGYEDEKGFWHPGAIEILARDCTVRLVESHDDDAAGLMQAGRQADVEALISGAQHHLRAALDNLH